MWLLLAATICAATPAHLEGDVPSAGGDYVDVAFEVPAGIQEIRIAHRDGSATDISTWARGRPTGTAAGAATSPRTR